MCRRTNDFTNTVAGYENLVVGNLTNGSVTGLTEGVQYYYRVRAENAGGVSANSTTTTVTTLTKGAIGLPSGVTFTVSYGTNPLSQEVVFTNWGQTAYAYSNEVSYGVGASNWLTFVPNTGTVAGSGAQVVTAAVVSATLNVGTYMATQAVVSSDATNSPQQLMVTLTITQAAQTISFPTIPDQLTTNHVGLGATAGSGLPVTFATNGGPAAIGEGTNLTFTGTGMVRIVAWQAGTSNWAPAASVTQEFQVTKATASVTLTNLNQTYDGTARVVGATTAPTGLTVNITYDGAPWAPTNAGSYAVTGRVNDAIYQGEAGGTLAVSKANQVITNFPIIPNQIITNVVTLTAQASSGLEVLYWSVGPCEIAGTQATFNGVGEVTIGAFTDPNENWNDALQILRTFTVYPAIPSITQAVSSNILAHSAELGGTITATNGGVVSQRGVVWSTTTNFDVSSGRQVGEDGEYGTGSFRLSVTGLYGGTIHYFRAYAANITGTNYTEQAWFLTRPDAPAVDAAANIGTHGFDANWSASTSATNYLLDVSVTNNFTNYVAGYEQRVVGNLTNGSVTGLTAGIQYYYRVRAENATGASTNSAMQSVWTLPPAPVVQPASDVTTNRFTARWSAATSATNYLLDVSLTNDFTSTVAGYENLSVGDTTDGSVTGLSAGTEYHYRLRAQNPSGYSDYSATQSVWTVPSAPDILTATNNTTESFDAHWSEATGATNYLLDASVTNDFTNYVAGYSNLLVGTGLTYTVTGLTYGTEYHYRLRAENSGGLSVNSTTQSAWTVPLAPVAQAATEALTNDFTAHWNEALSATNYLLDVSVTNDFTSMVAVYTNLSVGNVTNYSVTGLTPALTYYYRLRAQNPGGISTNSNVQFLTLLKGRQTITNFTHIGDQIVTNTVHLEAQASSGLPVSFIPTRGAELTMISGGTNLTFTGTGVVDDYGDPVWRRELVHVTDDQPDL